MSRTVGSLYEDGYCFPRVSGDEPPIQKIKATLPMFSPRERG